MDIHNAITQLGELLQQRNMMLGTAESCTGGLIAAHCTDISGASGWFAGGIVSSSNDIKERVLGVPSEVLAQHGAVSEPAVRAMAEGACTILNVPCTVAVSGIAGPTGGTPGKPVGTVWMAIAIAGQTTSRLFTFAGSREAIRTQTVEAAIQALTGALS